jgi:hypothetical protein
LTVAAHVLAMERITRPTLTERVTGRRIEGLAYDAENGLLRIELVDGQELLVSACWEGCQVTVEQPRRPDLGQDSVFALARAGLAIC